MKLNEGSEGLTRPRACVVACGAQRLRARQHARCRPAHGTGSVPSHRLLPLLAPSPSVTAPLSSPSSPRSPSSASTGLLPPPHLPFISLSLHCPSHPPSPSPASSSSSPSSTTRYHSPLRPPSISAPISLSLCHRRRLLFSSHFLASVATPSPVFSSSRHRPSRLRLPLLLLLRLRRAPPVIAPHPAAMADNPDSATVPSPVSLSPSSTPVTSLRLAPSIVPAIYRRSPPPPPFSPLGCRTPPPLPCSPSQPPSPSTSAPLLSLLHRRRLPSSSIIILHWCRPPPLAPTPTSSSTGDLPLLPRFPCHCRFLSFVLPSPTTALTIVVAAAVLRRREPPLPASPPSQSPTPPAPGNALFLPLCSVG